jgi:hypothetical protein
VRVVGVPSLRVPVTRAGSPHVSYRGA